MDIFTRMVADGADRFDETPPGYRGPLYLEIVSRSFTILIRHGMSMNQIRLIRGNPGLGPPELAEEHGRFPLALLGGKPMELTPADLEGGVPLSVDLSGGRDGIVGYRARRNSGLLDLTSSRPHNRDDFWEPLRAEQGRRLVLEPEEFLPDLQPGKRAGPAIPGGRDGRDGHGQRGVPCPLRGVLRPRVRLLAG